MCQLCIKWPTNFTERLLTIGISPSTKVDLQVTQVVHLQCVHNPRVRSNVGYNAALADSDDFHSTCTCTAVPQLTVRVHLFHAQRYIIPVYRILHCVLSYLKIYNFDPSHSNYVPPATVQLTLLGLAWLIMQFNSILYSFILYTGLLNTYIVHTDERWDDGWYIT